ncbi:hypothetical protein GCM10010222_74290 [Streptomyces tanashiensis]|nr:hypothetical protein GCM10010222_74290 [Streptomyces tanashiensis]
MTGPHQRRDENDRSRDNRPPDRLQSAICHFAVASGAQGRFVRVGSEDSFAPGRQATVTELIFKLAD